MTALAAGSLAIGTENYETRPLGTIGNGQTLGSFTYSFNPAVTQAAVASDGNGGRALGGALFDVFVGGDSVTLHFGGVRPLVAFGADYFYAPSFESAPADIYRLSLLDGVAAGTTASNGPGLDPAGGSFFLGFIEDAASAFRDLRVFAAIPTDAEGDPLFLDAAYQVDNLVFAASDLASADVPIPGTLPLMALGGGLLAVIARRKPASFVLK